MCRVPFLDYKNIILSIDAAKSQLSKLAIPEFKAVVSEKMKEKVEKMRARIGEIVKPVQGKIGDKTVQVSKITAELISSFEQFLSLNSSELLEGLEADIQSLLDDERYEMKKVNHKN